VKQKGFGYLHFTFGGLQDAIGIGQFTKGFDLSIYIRRRPIQL
jgi:hypothetical protein